MITDLTTKINLLLQSFFDFSLVGKYSDQVQREREGRKEKERKKRNKEKKRKKEREIECVSLQEKVLECHVGVELFDV